MDQNLKPQYYSRRLLNPFRGALQVVSLPKARATSLDGIHWQLQIKRDFVQLPDDTENPANNQYINFGAWSEQQGLLSFPNRPLMEFNGIHCMTEVLLSKLKQMPSLPFPAADHVELWLWQKDENRPLLLMASELLDSPMTLNENRWLPGNRHFSEFNTQGLFPLPAELPCNGDYLLYLKNLIAGNSNNGKDKIWCRHEQGGQTRVLASSLTDINEGDTLASALFPPLLLQQQWQHQPDRQLISAYLDWLAPYYLCLQDLGKSSRRDMETAACKQAEKLHSIHKLIPLFVNKEMVNAALVQAMLQRNN